MNFLTRNADVEFHFMVDIETLATSCNAAITEIGCFGKGRTGDNWFFRQECTDESGEGTQATLDWRLENKLPWATAGESGIENCRQVLLNFFEHIKFVADDRIPILWCKGTDFDAVILTNAAKRYGVADQIPWKYNDINDVRTLLRLFPQFKVPRDQVTHNALEDAILQYTYLEKIADHVARLESNSTLKPGMQP